MKCPIDGATLTMSERSGIEIDYCPECRGVWLDRGELDKIIDRSLEQQPAAAPPTRTPTPSRPMYESHDSEHGQRYRKKRKESWLSELFD